MEVSMFPHLRTLWPLTRQLISSKPDIKARRSSINISFRSLIAGLLVFVLFLSTQPWSVWSSGASAVKEAVAPISSRIKPNELVSGISDWFKGLTRSKPAKPTLHERSAARLKVHGHRVRMSVGSQQQITAIAVDNNDIPVDGISFRWQSSNTEVAAIDETGIVKAVSIGQTDITATSGFLRESFHIQVQQHVVDDPIPDPRDIVPTSGSRQQTSFTESNGNRYKYRMASYRSGGTRSAASSAPAQFGTWRQVCEVSRPFVPPGRPA